MAHPDLQSTLTCLTPDMMYQLDRKLQNLLTTFLNLCHQKVGSTVAFIKLPIF